MAKRSEPRGGGIPRFLLVRVLPGIGLIAAALLLSRLLDGPLGPAPRQGWRQLVWIVASGAPSVGGLFYILLGWHGLAGGAGLVLFFALISTLPQPWDRLMLVATIGLCLLAPLLLKSRRRVKESAPPAEGAEGKGTASVGPDAPYRSALVCGTGLGIAYQLFASPEELRFYRVGNLLTGAKKERLQPVDAPLRRLGERDFRITAREVEQLRFAAVDCWGIQPRMRIRANGRTRTFAPLDFAQASMCAFLDALRDFAPDRREDPDGLFEIGPMPAQFDLARARRLKVALAALARTYYVPGFVSFLNFLPDAAAPDVRPALVTRMTVEEDDNCALELAVIDGGEKLRIHVSPERFDQISPGDEIRLAVHPGWLGIPYYDLELNP